MVHFGGKLYYKVTTLTERQHKNLRNITSLERMPDNVNSVIYVKLYKRKPKFLLTNSTFL